MASFSVPCSMISVLSVSSSHSSSTHQPHVSVSLRSGPALLPRIQGSSRHQSQVFKVNAQLNEVIRSGDGFEEELSNYLSNYFKGETFEEESSNDLAGEAFEEKLSNYFKGETFEEESSNDFEGEGFEGELPNDFEGEAFEEELSNYFKGETFEEESFNDFEGELPNDLAGGLSRAYDFANDLAGETLEGESSGETRKYGHLWVVCENCYTLNYKKYFLEKMYICEGCGSHVPMHSSDRIELLVDPGSWEPMYEGIFSLDPIEFHSEEDPYKDRIDYYQRETGLTEAVQTGIGQLNGIPIALGVMDFRFIGGSMGSVVGERITRLIEHAANQNLPLILVCASGGARMQEGSLSLMQMAKISSALYDYQSNQKLLYISILTSPTTGGVTASFGMLGDIVIAEPNAYIAFAGKRVIEETLNIIVPEGVQETEYLFEKGSFDLIVPRKLLKSTLSELFELHGYVSFESKVKQNQVEH